MGWGTEARGTGCGLCSLLCGGNAGFGARWFLCRPKRARISAASDDFSKLELRVVIGRNLLKSQKGHMRKSQYICENHLRLKYIYFLRQTPPAH